MTFTLKYASAVVFGIMVAFFLVLWLMTWLKERK